MPDVVLIGPWRKSKNSPSINDCVEVAPIVGGTAIRDSKLAGASPVLALDAAEWDRVLSAIRGDVFG